MTQEPQQHSAQLAADAAGLTSWAIWLHHFSIGGNLQPLEVDAYLHDAHSLPVKERNLIALALNEMIDALPQRPRAALDEDQELYETPQDPELRASLGRKRPDEEADHP